MKSWLYNINRIESVPRPNGTDLRYSEWTQSLPKAVFNKFIKTLSWKDFALYPDVSELKTQIADLHKITPLNVYLSPGSAEGIKNIVDCYGQTQTLTTTDPCFPMYEVYAKQNGMLVEKISPEDNLTYKAKLFSAQDLIIISRPSNPVGYVFTRKDIIRILENNTHAWVVVDEAYIDYAENVEPITDLISVYDNLIISRSFSKVFGAAGARVGYLISHSNNIDLISKFRQMYELSGPAVKYAMFLLNNQKIVNKYCRNTIKERKKILGFFESCGYRVIPSQGNWIHVEQTSELLECLKENNIHVKTDIILPLVTHTSIRMTVGPGVYSIIRDLIPKKICN